MADAGPVYFKDTRATPPGGVFFYVAPGGERVEGRHFSEIERRVAALLEKYHDPRSVERAVAEYMCPRISGADWFCQGPVVASPSVRPPQALSNSLPYCRRSMVPFDVIERRMQVCLSCPKHVREWCPSCTGHLARLDREMRGRRPHLAEDRPSGVCSCAKAYEYALASVEYAPGEPIWEGTPDSCWRKTDV